MIALFPSVTTANRIRSFLAREGCYVDVIQTPKRLSKGGCSYSLRFAERQLENVRRAAAELGATIKGIYE